MGLHDIVVLFDGSDAGAERLRIAIALTTRLRGRLSGVGVVPPAVPIEHAAGLADDGKHGSIERAEVQPSFEGVRLIDLTERRFRSDAGELALKWVPVDRGQTKEIIQLGRLSDLIILGQTPPDPGIDPWGFGPEDVVLEVGGPCLIVPYAGTFESLGRRILVAWDGSREAARALRDAKPFLREAAEITIIGVSHREYPSETDGLSVQQVAAHLGVQGIKATPRSEQQGELRISDVLLDRASDFGADLLVTGSFHHSPIRESLVGGVSRELLKHMTLPVLVSH